MQKKQNIQYVLRKSIINDIKYILDIDMASFGLHHWSYNAFVSEFTNEYSHYLTCVDSLDNTNIIGYIGYWKILDEGHITTLAVNPLYRRNGFADILLYNLIINAIKKKIKWLTLEVRASNLSAQNLYRKFLFKNLGIRKKYYQDNNEDALILWTNNISSQEYLEHIKQFNFSKDVYADKSH